MIIGILSDTHGNVSRTALACAKLRARGVDVVMHCGDIGSEAVLLELASAFDVAGTPVHAVLGNVDCWNDAILHFPTTTVVQIHGTFGDLDLDGHRIALVHGHESHRLHHALHAGMYTYLFTGHTHQAEDRRQGGTRLINPGAVHRSATPSLAVLDLATDALEHMAL